MLWRYGISFNEPSHGWVIGTPIDDALALAWPAGQVRLGDEQVPIRELVSADDFSGTHDPMGVFLAAGPGIAEGPRVDLSVLDIAPLVFHLSSQPIPDDLDGELPAQLLAPAWLAAHPPRSVAAAELPSLDPDPREPGRDEAVTERLRSLGYVE